MKALNEYESVALCLVDLAKGYARRYLDSNGSFILQCLDLALKHFPDCIDALLMRAELKKSQLTKKLIDYGLTNLLQAKTHPTLKADYTTMEESFLHIAELGYRQMPKKMYIDWLLSVEAEKEKFEHKKVKGF